MRKVVNPEKSTNTVNIEKCTINNLYLVKDNVEYCLLCNDSSNYYWVTLKSGYRVYEVFKSFREAIIYMLNREYEVLEFDNYINLYIYYLKQIKNK